MNEKDIQTFYTYLQSEQTAQQFLFSCYQKIEGVNAEVKSYENCNTFIYYLDHGHKLYKSGKELNTALQPILLFYGMVHLLKAVLITKRPNYPETTKMLAHGVSTRKRKKRQYTFLNDEVKIQQNGLFPYFSEHLFSLKNLSVDKFKMHYLLALIPEMSLLFSFKKQNRLTVVGSIESRFILFPVQLLNNYHLTANAFIQRVTPYLPNIIQTDIDQETIQIRLSTPLAQSSGPFFFHGKTKNIHFPTNRDHFLAISEVMVHYLILYNLSMLSRYETEWWGELLATKSDEDYPFISHFLKTTSEKIPLLLGRQLYKSFLED